MKTTRTSGHLLLVLALASVLAIGVLSGCAGSSTTAAGPTPADTATARKALTVAMSTLSTMAPDAKLLVAQSAGAITPTSTPAWQFLIGSPKTDIIYDVMVKDGKGDAQEYGPAGLSAAEWKAVPAASAWKIDSNTAHANAVALFPGGKTAGYMLGFVTYVPKSAGKTGAQAMRWFVAFDPASKGSAPTSTVDVDMATGAATFAK